ncbi:hypothetical protein LC728_13575 [Bacillus amyloliquefaciens]|uniref:hypothetical protein n=1 Tax=Bacillus TaxID=1386 RepID=UPI001CD19FF9|nr:MULTISPECIES: hypothetical protein [Bacillus]MCA1215402.1 hypothetical protein [Bacillus amyloliquefaciens]MCC8303767.1 hypothetical protein [Bacillus sp. AF12]MDV9079847.1 hypothetical protein [Bacillus sp. ICE1]
MVYAGKRSGLRSDAEYVSDLNAAWIPPAYKGTVRDPGMIILTARMCSGAAREGDSIRRQIRCDRFNQRRPWRIRQT